ncbi:MAG: NAD-dependent epimerase/dehydratase family protein [Candidatus Acidiferrales bacterium]
MCERSVPSGRVSHVLVLGGAGYLGSVLVTQLLHCGYRVRVLDSLIFGESSLDHVKPHPRFELVRGDVRDVGVVVRSIRGCDAIVHLAGIVGDPACDENKQLAMDVNRAATRMLIDVARESGVSRFVFASSCSVYGASESLVCERSALAPLSVYAQTKVDAEKTLLEAAGDDFTPTVFRLGTLFGLSKRMRFDLVVNLLLARAVSTGKIAIFNGDQWRPFLHVQDAAGAFIDCMEFEPSRISGEVFNVGSPHLNLQLKELGDAMARVVPNTRIDIVQNEDRRSYRVSFEKVERVLRFRCRETLESGIREMYSAIRSDPVADFSSARFNNQIAMRALA